MGVSNVSIVKLLRIFSLRPRGIEPRLQDPQSCVLSIERRARNKMPTSILRGFTHTDKRKYDFDGCNVTFRFKSKSKPTGNGIGERFFLYCFGERLHEDLSEFHGIDIAKWYRYVGHKHFFAH